MSFGAQGFRFLIVGCANTLAGYLIYLALLGLTGYRFAYSLAFVVGILIAYILNSRFVFKTALSLRAMFQYPVVYLIQYCSGLLLLMLLVDYFGIEPRIAPLISVILLAPPACFFNPWLLISGGVP